ncbi:GNAT family N-acetyltransferase [Pseudocolwellia sp. HL-MZ19]|uniref:GNAT family N-acetyltransferase n=1 Tax=unclassified Pseudocolwellia TaxID=2848178 RepID=UPI003CEC18D4
MKLVPVLETKNLIITILTPADFKLLVEYQNNNKQHLSQWEPIRTPEYFDEYETKKRIENSSLDYQLGNSISLVALNKDKNKIVSLCTFSNIVHGAFQACNLGYSINEEDQDKGLMYEMLNVSIKYVFQTYKLHRIMANYMPENRPSESLLIKLGFQKEGLAKSYLKIAGIWQDHILTSKISS